MFGSIFDSPPPQYQQWGQDRAPHTDPCWTWHHRLWSSTEGMLPPGGCADANRAGSKRHTQHCELLHTLSSVWLWVGWLILSHSALKIYKHTEILHTLILQRYKCKWIILLCFLSQVVSVSVVHVPDDKYSLSARVLFQYLLTSQGNMFELKVGHISAFTSLFMKVILCVSATESTLRIQTARVH